MRAVQQPGTGSSIDNISLAFGNMPTTAPGLAQGTGVNTKIKAANTTTYLCGSVFKSKATFEVAFTTNGNASFTGAQDVTPNAATVQERVYMVSLDASGTPTVTAGAQATGAGNAQLPERPADGNTPIGYLRIAVAAGASGFQANTTQPATAGAVTATYVDGYPLPLSSTSL